MNGKLTILTQHCHIYQSQKKVDELQKDGLDLKEAFLLHEKLANQGNATAQNNLGAMYYRGIYVEQDYKKAFEWFEKSANWGYAKAQNNLAILYKLGHGTQQDYYKALCLYCDADNMKGIDDILKKTNYSILKDMIKKIET